MGEFLVAKNGLGFLIVYGGQVAQLDMVMMSIVILSAIAFIMYEIVAFVEKKLIQGINWINSIKSKFIVSIICFIYALYWLFIDCLLIYLKKKQ